MWGFVADSASSHLCRFYGSALGHMPAPCLNNSGVPALAMTAIALLAAVILLSLVRKALQA